MLRAALAFGTRDARRNLASRTQGNGVHGADCEATGQSLQRHQVAVAQLVARRSHNPKVVSSILTCHISWRPSARPNADIAFADIAALQRHDVWNDSHNVGLRASWQHRRRLIQIFADTLVMMGHERSTEHAVLQPSS